MGRRTRYILIYTAVLFFLGAGLGLIIGMNIGGNYFETFQLGSWTGYEATGMLGLMFGALIGGLSGLLLGKRVTKKMIETD